MKKIVLNSIFLVISTIGLSQSNEFYSIDYTTQFNNYFNGLERTVINNNLSGDIDIVKYNSNGTLKSVSYIEKVNDNLYYQTNFDGQFQIKSNGYYEIVQSNYNSMITYK